MKLNSILSTIFGVGSVDALNVLIKCGGYYERQTDSNAEGFTPLVGYAGKYKDEATGDMLQYVGKVYANWAKAEENPFEMLKLSYDLARQLTSSIDEYDEYTFCGAPMGGLSLAFSLALVLGGRYIFAEKKTVELATETSREKSKLFFGRHEVISGEKIILCEDVLNNFSTTGELLGLINKAKGRVVAITALLDRSLDQMPVFQFGDDEIPVIPLVHKVIMQYRQDDPAVADEIAKGNVVWKPKDEWDRLMASRLSEK